MDMENKHGLTVQSILVNGVKIVLMGRVDSFMLMEMFMMVNGQMIRRMDTGFIDMLMVQCMKGSGKMIFNMVKDQSHGQTKVNTKVNMHMDANMEQVAINGMMEASIQAIGEKIKLVAQEFTLGQMDDAMKENGSKITWKGWASIFGTMVACIKANIKTTKSMDLVYIAGQMAVVMRDTGLEGSSMVLVPIKCQKKKK